MVRRLGGVSPAARAWGLHDASLRRFLSDASAGVNSATIKQVCEATGREQEELFQ